MMKRVLLVVLFSFCILINSIYPQKLEEPKLVGTWVKENEDYGEFIAHKVEAFAFYDLPKNPKANMVARLCSTEKMSVALVDSVGSAYQLPGYAKYFKAPSDRFFFARWSKCEGKSEQYWIVPEGSKFEYDEMISAEKIEVKRLIEDYEGSPTSQSAKKEFAENIKEFIAELKNNPKAEGFIIRNFKTDKHRVKEALKRIQKENIDKSRYQIIRKRIYETHYPEFMTVTIKE